MNVIEYCDQVLNNKDLASKLTMPNVLEFDNYEPTKSLPDKPARDSRIAFSNDNVRFPKFSALSIPEKKALAFNSFANHELLAVEIMAYAILKLPHQSDEDFRFKKAILLTMKDEQKHFKLYQKRMNELGYEFGDFPLNDFFWRQAESIINKETYLAIMAMTFESANLDFASYYRDVFYNLGDKKSAEIMDQVFQDEISHVALGVNYFNRWRENQSLWDYYKSVLPWPMTPARSKGKIYNSEARVLAKMDQDFINKLKYYRDDFKITDRKEWKNESIQNKL